MTKRVRIENADTAHYGVMVQVWDKGYPEGQPDVLAKEVPLLSPCTMTGDDVFITDTRYLKIVEIPAPKTGSTLR